MSHQSFWPTPKYTGSDIAPTRSPEGLPVAEGTFGHSTWEVGVLSTSVYVTVGSKRFVIDTPKQAIAFTDAIKEAFGIA